MLKVHNNQGNKKKKRKELPLREVSHSKNKTNQKHDQREGIRRNKKKKGAFRLKPQKTPKRKEGLNSRAKSIQIRGKENGSVKGEKNTRLTVHPGRRGGKGLRLTLIER